MSQLCHKQRTPVRDWLGPPAAPLAGEVKNAYIF